MAKVKEEKTNVMRVLDQKKIPYTPHAYPHGDGEAPDGVTVARSLGQGPERVFKTLVTRGASGGYYVFDIPVTDTLDLKKAAKAVGEKSIAMLHSRELLLRRIHTILLLFLFHSSDSSLSNFTGINPFRSRNQNSEASSPVSSNRSEMDNRCPRYPFGSFAALNRSYSSSGLSVSS